ncbi:MAG: 16S rRNA (adenine(1518)-N(6)/adenine(1519)-N(6))-dimethyltransferase RsmA [Planctomycetaceae bacterium]|nr:16S rRNA (adenine(1518)-N(6)/adenine(1519)-N(6))-dimethyltransferase RsmA [Planctomycetaceae bacterium]
MPSPRQTQSYLIQRFQEAGVKPQTRHGQNFLIDLNLLDLLLDTADLGPSDVVLEVGTGLASLTARMAELAAAVVTVEIDPRLFQLASEELSAFDNVVMLQQDALKSKNHMHPAVLDAIRAKVAEQPGRQLKLVANLPYNVATPVLSNLLSIEPLPVSMTATIQKELADRICAAPGTKDYSALSIWMQAQCDIAIVRTMPPQVFWPRPKVTSAIIHIVPNPQRRAAIADLPHFHHFVRSLFLHRRKYLRGVLVSMLKGRLERTDVDALLAAFQFSPDVRAEQLDVPTLVALADAFRQAASTSGIATDP